MSSLKMTFSLTSLILIFAFAFGTVSVMAHTAETHTPANPRADHEHPVVTIEDPTDADARTSDIIEVLDKAADDETGLIGTIEFDVMLTLPSVGLDTTAATGQITDAEVTAIARTDQNVPIGTATGAVAASGKVLTVDANDATMITLALTISNTFDDDGDNDTTEDQQRVADLAKLIEDGLYVDIYVNAEAITVTGLVVNAPMQGQSNLQSDTLTVKVIAPVDRTPPVLTATPADPATDGSVTVELEFDEMLDAAPTVSAAAVNADDATDTADYSGTYEVSDATAKAGADNTYEVTVTPNAATLDMPMIPELTVTLTVSAMDDDDNAITTGNTVAVTLAARTYMDETAPTVTVVPLQGAQGKAFDIRITATDNYSATADLTVAVAITPESAVTDDAPMATRQADGSYMVTVTPVAATAANPTIAASTITVTATATDEASNDGSDSEFFFLAERTYTPPPDTTAPTLTASQSTDATTGVITVTLAFDEALSADPAVTHAAMPAGLAGTYTVSVMDDGDASTTNTYTVTVTPSALAIGDADLAAGTVTLTVSASDTATPPNMLTTGNTVPVALEARTAPRDTDVPTFTSDAPTEPISESTVVNLTFTEEVTGVGVTGTPSMDDAKYTAVVAGSGMAYTVTVTPISRDNLAEDMSQRIVTFAVSGADAAENDVAGSFSLILAARKVILLEEPTPTFGSATVSVPPLTVGTAMTAVSLPAATGGTGTLSYSLWVENKDITASGYNGLSYDPAKVVLMGTPLREDPTGTSFIWRATDSATSHSEDLEFTVVVNPKPDTSDKRAVATLSGIPSLTEEFQITITFDKAAALSEGDILITPADAGHVTANSLLSNAANTVHTVRIQPFTGAKTISVTVKTTSDIKPAAVGGSLSKSAPIGTLSSITVPTGADDRAKFIATLTFTEALPSDLVAGDLTVTGGTITSVDKKPRSADKVWEVEIMPTGGVDVVIGLSDAGMERLTYAGPARTVTKYVTPDRPPTSSEGTLAGLSVAAESFVVIVRDANVKGLPDSLPSKATQVIWADMPDLEDLLYVGGSIVLTRAKAPKLDHDGNGKDPRDAAARDLIITEVMWAKNTALTGRTGELYHQWIEIYNPLKTAVDGVTLKTKKGRPALDKTGDDVLLDRLSNLVGNGWELSGLGQNGSMDSDPNTNEVNFVSMYRSNRGKEGWTKGHWAASTEISVTGHLSTPGRLERKISKAIVGTNVLSSPFVINEFGIGNNDGEDWIELRNVTSSKQNLKNLLLTSVTGLDKEEIEFHFHDKGLEVPANRVVLITSTDPRDTDLAAGVNLEVAADDQDKTGVTSLYVVRNFELPTGKFNLILRNGYNNKPGDFLGKALGNIVDAIGSLKVAKETATFRTEFWPLNGKGAPHGDVIEGLGQDFKAGTVYVRKNAGANAGTGEHHLGKVGYTGIGYDRAAVSGDPNGGTPGYPNDTIKEKVADLSNATITFSEIMLDTGPRNQRLPQWIELYNSSMTQSVNLNGWKLTVENSATDEAITTRVDATITLKSMTISPNQTVLIVTTTGRNSDAKHFPRSRVVNLWTDKDHRAALGTSSRTEQVFSTVGLYLKLTDKDNKLVDEFGNLDGKSRTRRETPTWVFPMNEDNGDNRRSSLIRRYDDGEIEAKGTVADAWVLASKTNFANLIANTYYGNPDDYGTPGFRGGGPLPVSLSKFRPERLKDTGEIVVRWVTESELNNAGFNILRSEKRDSGFTKVHFEAGKGTTSERQVYEWKDTTATKPNVVYYYQIQDVSLDGKVTTLRTTHLRGNVTAVGKATTTWGEIKALQ